MEQSWIYINYLKTCFEEHWYRLLFLTGFMLFAFGLLSLKHLFSDLSFAFLWFLSGLLLFPENIYLLSFTTISTINTYRITFAQDTFLCISSIIQTTFWCNSWTAAAQIVLWLCMVTCCAFTCSPMMGWHCFVQEHCLLLNHLLPSLDSFWASSGIFTSSPVSLYLHLHF